MGLRDDLDRYLEVGEAKRQDLAEFIQYGDLGRSRHDRVRIPIKLVDLPEFVYDRRDMGGVGQGTEGTPEPGDRIGRPTDDGDEAAEGEAGDQAGEHEYYEMDPDEFAEELDEELGLDLEPKGKRVETDEEGEYTDLTRTGPDSTLDVERLFREGLKRKLAVDFDDRFARELLRVKGVDVDRAFRWLRERNVPISRRWLEEADKEIPDDERGRWSSIDEMTENVEYEPTIERIRREGLGRVPFRREDERYRYPEPVTVPSYNVVVVNIRDVSGSMRQEKRELVERTFTPLDWYLQGKYDTAEFVYIAHDATAWEVEREEFFGIRSGGGTKISSAYELTREILEERYPWNEWNRYVFAAGDSENSSNDTAEKVIPLMEEINANLHAYVETQPSGSAINATHAEEVDRQLGDHDNVAVAYVSSPSDVTDAIYEILSTEEA